VKEKVAKDIQRSTKDIKGVQQKSQKAYKKDNEKQVTFLHSL
jgi:hypothetical protein